jgi:hypothetical protein
MWAVDRLICVCHFQQICNFLIRECSGFKEKLRSALAEDSGPVRLEETLDSVWPHGSPRRLLHSDFMVSESGRGILVAFAVSRSFWHIWMPGTVPPTFLILLHVIADIENPECSYTCSYIDENFYPRSRLSDFGGALLLFFSLLKCVQICTNLHLFLVDFLRPAN